MTKSFDQSILFGNILEILATTITMEIGTTEIETIENTTMMETPHGLSQSLNHSKDSFSSQ